MKPFHAHARDDDDDDYDDDDDDDYDYDYDYGRPSAAIIFNIFFLPILFSYLFFF